MRISIAVHHFPPRHTGGAELRAARTASQLQARGLAVQVICVEHTNRGPRDGVDREDGCYEGIPVQRLSFDLAAAPNQSVWEYDNAWIGRYLEHHLAENRPDVFHLIGGYLLSGRALRSAQRLGIPTVLTLTDFWFLCPRIQMWRSNRHLCDALPDAAACARCLAEEKRRFRLPGRVAPRLAGAYWHARKDLARRIEARRAFLFETLHRTDCIVSPSRFLRRFFVQAGIAPERIVFVRQGRDFPDAHPRHLGRPAGPNLEVGYIGKIAPHKGVHLLFEAVRRLPGAAVGVHVYGDASGFPRYEKRLRQQAKGDARLTLEGRFPPEALARVLRGLDVLVLPSVWYENSPNAILEAFAHHTPVIVSNAGGMAELVEHEVSGLHFRIGDAGDLARQLQRLVEQPTLLKTLRAGIPPVKTLAEEMDELCEIYDRVAAGSRCWAAQESQCTA